MCYSAKIQGEFSRLRSDSGDGFFHTETEGSMMPEMDMRTDPIIELKALGKTFPTPDGSLEVLKKIDLCVMPGDIYGVIGLSGAGKSTLVRCINYLERPTCGTVLYRGKEVGAMKRRERDLMRREMGMIFQQFNLLMQSTVEKNVSFPLEIAGWRKNDIRLRVRELLDIVGLTDKIRAYPAQLSGGQKQRVAIARALALRPSVLLCDEATSALDPATTLSILDLIQQINREFGITVIIITHEMSVVKRICSHVAVIDEGEIVETGQMEELFRNPRHPKTRQFISPDGDKLAQHMGEGCYRLVFDGVSAGRPVIADLARSCGVDVNILYARMEKVDGLPAGQMIVSMGDDKEAIDKALCYLEEHKIAVHTHS
jgi:D-methionine transport system ATP-binding protein